MAEAIVLVDESGRPTGTAEKLASHHASTPLHLAFSCYLFNDRGQFLVSRRAFSKKVWPGVWTNSVCGHPAPNEEMIEAIKRRIREELGMTARNFQPVLPTYRYRTPAFLGVIENEYCPVYVAHAIGEPMPNKEEVEGWQWMDWHDYVNKVESDKDNNYSWWCRDQLVQLKNHPLISQYTS